jgi:hypothetical protein
LNEHHTPNELDASIARAHADEHFAIENPTLDAIERRAKTLRVPMTHVPRDAEYLPVLRYRIGQEIEASTRRADALRDMLSDLDELAYLDNDATQSKRVPQVHEFATSGEAYDASQTDDTIHDGDVLVVRNGRAVAIMLSAWPTATDEDLSGEHFHVAEASLDWTRVPAIDPNLPSHDYSRSIEIAQPIIDEIKSQS